MTTAKNTMIRVRSLAAGSALLLALAATAQPAATRPAGAADVAVPVASRDGANNVQGHLKALTEKLGLTADQQAKLKPILQELLDATQTIMQDQSIPREAALAKAKALHMKASKKFREYLSDDQKQKLDQLERESHSETRANQNGPAPKS
jgi:Spy/CpxP family protein refolding chaperone